LRIIQRSLAFLDPQDDRLVRLDLELRTLQRTRGPVRRRPHTAIDDVTRIRAPKIYRPHTQARRTNRIGQFANMLPLFWICVVRAHGGHEFQALFHRLVADLGTEHVYIGPRPPQPTERWSDRTDGARMNATCFSGIVRTRISRTSWPIGSTSTAAMAHPQLAAAEHHTRRSEEIYGRDERPT
jgi:hypothetical protein